MGEISDLLKWIIFIIAYFILFISWSYVPIERLDKHAAGMNQIGRPFLNTIILTGLPAIIAKLWELPAVWALIPLTLICSLYSNLAGRFIQKFKKIAAAVCLAINIVIWLMFYTT